MARDPVCGVEVDPARTHIRAEYEGEQYAFCCEPCRQEFLRHPDRYTGKNLREAMTKGEAIAPVLPEERAGD